MGCGEESEVVTPSCPTPTTDLIHKTTIDISMDPVQQVVDATFASRETARRLLKENNNDVKSAIHAFRHPRGRVSGFGDLRNQQNGSDRVFTGGEKSGLAVQNRPSAKKNGIVDEIINKARQQAPQDLSDDEQDPYSRATGFRLGQGEEASQEFPAHRELEHVQRTFTFWSNGFSIDDGPLHSFDDPMTQTYLDRINSGNAPVDLMNVEPNQVVDLRLEDRGTEEYFHRPAAPTAQRAVPSYQGSGNRLGTSRTEIVDAPTPVVVEEEQARPSTPAPPTTTTGSTASGSGDAVVQLRLADGSSRRVRVSSDDTIQRLYELVGPADREYVLQTPMPPKTLDKDLTIRDAGVKNAVVVQRWI